MSKMDANMRPFLFSEQILRIWNAMRGCGVQLVKADSIIGRIRDI